MKQFSLLWFFFLAIPFHFFCMGLGHLKKNSSRLFDVASASEDSSIDEETYQLLCRAKFDLSAVNAEGQNVLMATCAHLDRMLFCLKNVTRNVILGFKCYKSSFPAYLNKTDIFGKNAIFYLDNALEIAQDEVSASLIFQVYSQFLDKGAYHDTVFEQSCNRFDDDAVSSMVVRAPQELINQQINKLLALKLSIDDELYQKYASVVKLLFKRLSMEKKSQIQITFSDDVTQNSELNWYVMRKTKKFPIEVRGVFSRVPSLFSKATDVLRNVHPNEVALSWNLNNDSEALHNAMNGLVLFRPHILAHRYDIDVDFRIALLQGVNPLPLGVNGNTALHVAIKRDHTYDEIAFLIAFLKKNLSFDEFAAYMAHQDGEKKSAAYYALNKYVLRLCFRNGVLCQSTFNRLCQSLSIPHIIYARRMIPNLVTKEMWVAGIESLIKIRLNKNDFCAKEEVDFFHFMLSRADLKLSLPSGFEYFDRIKKACVSLGACEAFKSFFYRCPVFMWSK